MCNAYSYVDTKTETQKLKIGKFVLEKTALFTLEEVVQECKSKGISEGCNYIVKESLNSLRDSGRIEEYGSYFSVL